VNEQPNINALWGALLVEELWRQGVRHVVLAPGSRSTPLVVAAAKHRGLRCHVIVDERAAAFFALGIARGSAQPAAVITTSGTAVANLAPAVVEAAIDRVPMLLLTADRPPELRDCGAPQTIDQGALFTSYLRWRFELPPPDDRMPARAVLTAAAHGYARARDGLGPVQINCMFREPLAPAAAQWDHGCLAGLEGWNAGKAPYTRAVSGPRVLSDAQIDAQAAALAQIENGVVVAGALPADAGAAVLELAARLGWPLWADVRSGLRLHDEARPHVPHLARALDARGTPRPGAVLQLGARLTEQRVQQIAAAARTVWLVEASDDRLDPGHAVTARVCADVAPWCRAIAARIEPRGDAPILAAAAEADRRVEAAIEAHFAADRSLTEPYVARWLSAHVPEDHGLFVSSSMPIRDLQTFARRDGPALRVAANRGASGIDGVLASAAGYAVGRGGPVTLLIGDLALLHDLGSMALLGKLGHTFVAVLLNNGGGSIFGLLPIAAHGDVFSPWFDAPHSFTFAGTARDFGVAHALVTTRDELAQSYRAALQRGGATLLEVRSSLAENRDAHLRLEEVVRRALA
jgi:2-succinyl-5-enolpyruvyl-6-hydroxy-3-cyclohexene-1-carboxylate synthase